MGVSESLSSDSIVISASISLIWSLLYLIIPSPNEFPDDVNDAVRLFGFSKVDCETCALLSINESSELEQTDPGSCISHAFKGSFCGMLRPLATRTIFLSIFKLLVKIGFRYDSMCFCFVSLTLWSSTTSILKSSYECAVSISNGEIVQLASTAGSLRKLVIK
ncbi:hypothetical protein OGAPHI_001808 [Ogataea philodendri]|uniref:Uncharacterized protein n=1 Tax=Ogataea philodendri TaxID=1378263 RepID=A0A9P8PB66_9ASCO|nr:uncharacterized protein OGAPHI_001808 [Ogataea philodendri]KAH3668054.1 hypothetical protein OGAPHI_001808 [Ogataea philodendri]